MRHRKQNPGTSRQYPTLLNLKLKRGLQAKSMGEYQKLGIRLNGGDFIFLDLAVPKIFYFKHEVTFPWLLTILLTSMPLINVGATTIGIFVKQCHTTKLLNVVYPNQYQRAID